MSASAGSEGGVNQHIYVKVNGQDGSEVFFKIKRSTQLRKLMTAYCDQRCMGTSSIAFAFLYDGRRLQPVQTPGEVAMEDGDEIDAVMHQTGGCITSTVG